jgi:hypothetical protein
MLPSPRTSAALQSGGRTGGGALGPSLIGGTILLRGPSSRRVAATLRRRPNFRPWAAVPPSLATRLMLHVRANGLEIIRDGASVKSSSKIKL